MSTTYLTRETLAKLREEHTRLVNDDLKQASMRINEAIEIGGTEDNALYDAEIEKQALIEKRIAEINDLLRDSQEIETPKQKKDIISLGAKVVVEVDGDVDTFRIVGSYEADPLKSLISDESPVGKQLLGLKPGDIVEVSTPMLVLKYKILKVGYE